MLQQQEQRLENFPIPGNPPLAPAAPDWGGEAEMTSVTSLESPTRLQSWARAAENIADRGAEQRVLQNNGTRTCLVVKDSRRESCRGVLSFPAWSNPGK